MGTTAEKINYAINATNDIAEGINNIGGNITQNTELADFRDELDKLYNEMPKVTQNGTSIKLENTRRGKMEIIPKGNTEQEKTNGYQCIAYPFVETTKTVNGLTFTDLGDGTVKVNGTSTANTDFILNTYNFVQGETYTIIDELTDNNYGKYTIMIPSYTSWGRNIYIGLNDRKYETFQADTSLQLRIQITIYANNTLNNVIFKPMLYKGSYDSSKEWEKYTNEKESPSPDYMQNIKVVTGTNAIKIGGINLIDKDNEIRQGGTVSASDLTRLSISANMKLKANTTYVLVTNLDLTKFYYAFVLGSTTAPWNVQQQLYDSGWITNINYFTYTTNQECYLNIPIRNISSSEIDIDDVEEYWFMLYEGSYDAGIDYEPYKETIERTLNLGNVELVKIGNNSDLIFKNEKISQYYDNTLIKNAWYIKEKIKKIDIDGTENWQQGNPYHRFFITLDGKYEDVVPLSNYFKGYATNMPSNTNGVFIQQVNETTIRINLYDLDYYNDLTNFVKWLKEHSVKVYYLQQSSAYSNIQITDTTLINQLEELNKVIGQGGTVVIETESESNNAQLIVNASALASFENS